MKIFNRVDCIPSYMFSELDLLKNKMKIEGQSIIDLSIGDPDLPTPEFVIESLKSACSNNQFHRYPPYAGTYEFRKAVADYYLRRFNVKLNTDEEIVALIGSKEGITHLTLALVDNDDIVLVPDPGYPIYKSSTYIAGGKPYTMPLTKDNSFIPDLSVIPDEIAKKTKLMYINYPNNPTGTVCRLDTFENIIKFAVENEIIVCNDAAYNEIVYDNNKPVSILCAQGAREVSVELGTLSKSYNMTGWRIGYAVGNKEVLKKLLVIKTNTDSGQFGAIQHAASTALNHGDDFIEYIKSVYRGRRDNAVIMMKKIGIDTIIPEGSFYLWFKIPIGYKSDEFAAKLIKECGVIVTPGNAFGFFGEGYCRIALTTNEILFKEAIEKIRLSIIG